MDYPKFHEGQKLRALFFNDEECTALTVSPDGPDSITVVMENGQMAGVPWALVKYVGEPDTKWNLAHMSGVEFLEE